MARSSRFFEIIQLLWHARGPLTAAAIADALEVTKRTIYRDIVTLQSMRVPIEGAAGVGYVLQPGFLMPPLMFDAEELEAITVGLALIGRTRDAGLAAAASRVASKIAAVVPAETDFDLDRPALIVATGSGVPEAGAAIDEVRSALRAARKVAFRYLDQDGRASERTVQPVALVYYTDAIVLAGWCELRNDFRHFRLDRMAGFALTQAPVPQRDRLRREWEARERGTRPHDGGGTRRHGG